MGRGFTHSFQKKARRAAAAYMACKSGATAIEYGLIAAGIALGVGVAAAFFGNTLKGYFEYFANYLSNPG